MKMQITFTKTTLADFDAAYALLETAFPYTERRDRAGQLALLDDPCYTLHRAWQNGQAIGLLAVWQLPGIQFIEHLAVDPALRNGGLGSALMRAYLAQAGQPVVLEAEPPEQGELPRRRIGFYQRLGFNYCPYFYLQPPLRGDTQPIALKLMTWPAPLDANAFAATQKLLYEQVYGLPGGILPPAESIFWQALDELVSTCPCVIDRPKGSAHPRYPHMVYPVDYGYLENTVAMDGGGIDVWVGSAEEKCITGVICTVDVLKRDSEIKILLACTPQETETIYRLHNDSPFMKGVYLPREKLT